MAAYVNANMSILVDTLDIAGFASQAQFNSVADSLEMTTLNSNGWRQYMPGMNSHTLNVSGYQDVGATGVDQLFTGTGTGQNVVTFCPLNGGAAVADPAFMFAGRTTTRTPLSGSIGDAAAFTLDWAGDGRAVRGQVLHPLAARTATASGTAATFTTPITGQSIWATFHVLALSGTASPTITFTIQTDDNSGFSSATTRLTSNAFTAIGSQFTSVAGPFAGETHIRVAWTISGTTPSMTFLVAAGVN
jgi:hypothetical protein